MNFEQIAKAWHIVGADIAGLQWDDFAKALAEQQARPQQEPVACSICNGSGHIDFDDLTRRKKNDKKWGRCLHCQPYTSPPPQRTWVERAGLICVTGEIVPTISGRTQRVWRVV